jgi:hypothetical protein
MKKLLYTALSVGALLTGQGLIGKETNNPAQKAAQNLVKFVDIVKKHKNQWLQYVADYHKAKYDLLMQEHNDIFNQKVKHIKKFADSSTLALNEAVLPDMVKMHKNCMHKWHKLCRTYEDKAKALHTMQVKEVADFENSVGMMQPMEE